MGKSYSTLDLNEKSSLGYSYGVQSSCWNVRIFSFGKTYVLTWWVEMRGCEEIFLPKAFWTPCSSPGSLGLSPDSSRSDAEKKASKPLLWWQDMKQYLTKASQANMMANQQLYQLQRRARLTSNCLFFFFKFY